MASTGQYLANLLEFLAPKLILKDHYYLLMWFMKYTNQHLLIGVPHMDILFTFVDFKKKDHLLKGVKGKGTKKIFYHLHWVRWLWFDISL